MQENKKKNFQDLISGIVIMALAAFFFWTTFGTKSFLGTGRGRTAPDTIPKIVAAAMFGHRRGHHPQVVYRDEEGHAAQGRGR